MHHFQHVEVHGEKDIRCSPLHQVAIEVPLLSTPLPFARNYRRVDAGDIAGQAVEITHDQLAVRHVLVEALQQLQQMSGEEQLFLGDFPQIEPLYYLGSDSIEYIVPFPHATRFVQFLCFQVEVQALRGQLVLPHINIAFLHALHVYHRHLVVAASRLVHQHFVVGQVVQHFQEDGVTSAIILVVENVLIDYADLAPLQHPGIGSFQFSLHVLAECGRYLYDVVLQFLKGLLGEVLEVKQDGLGSTPGPSSGLHDPNPPLVFQLVPHALFGLPDVVADGHAVVGFEYFGGSQPGIFRVLFEKFGLVVVEADVGLKVDRRGELPDLEI